MATSSAGPTSRGLCVGQYELQTKIAAGGMGEVFIAVRRGTARRVALKLLLPHLAEDPEFVRMFLDEARIAARLDHPNVVQILDLGQADDRYFIAMSLVEGVSLSTLLNACRERQLQLPLPVAQRIADGLCAGLAYAHGLADLDGASLALVHRDVTPHNLLLSTSGEVVLTDFGIAKAQDNLHQTRFGVVRGKFAYVAPEQLDRNAAVDFRADIYSAGVTVFETFTLVSPFTRASDLEIVDAVRSAKLPKANTLRPELGASFQRALEKATAREPLRRFHSVGAFHEALRSEDIADSAELGQWVTRLCEPSLRPFRGLPSGVLDGGTRSLEAFAATGSTTVPLAHLSAPAARSNRTSWVLGGIAMAVCTCVALIWVAERSRLPQAEWIGPATKSRPVATRVGLPDPDARVALQSQPRAAAVGLPAVDAGSPAPLRAIGYLHLSADPRIVLAIDGTRIERSAWARYPLAVGDHLLTFDDPRLGKRGRRSLQVVAGQLTDVHASFAR